MKKLGYLYLVVLLFCYSYSNAYEPQYQIGATGPNGGTVTSVNVVPTLVDTQSEMVGDYLEFTYTYEYEETVQETVQQTTTTTAIVITEKTDQLIDTGTVTNTNISTNCSWASGTDFCTAGENVGGGSKTYTFDVSDYTNKKELAYFGMPYYNINKRILEFNLDKFEDYLHRQKINLARVDLVIKCQSILKAKKNHGKFGDKSCVSWRILNQDLDKEDLIVDGEYKEIAND